MTDGVHTVTVFRVVTCFLFNWARCASSCICQSETFLHQKYVLFHFMFTSVEIQLLAINVFITNCILRDMVCRKYRIVVFYNIVTNETIIERKTTLATFLKRVIVSMALANMLISVCSCCSEFTALWIQTTCVKGQEVQNKKYTQLLMWTLEFT